MGLVISACQLLGFMPVLSSRMEKLWWIFIVAEKSKKGPLGLPFIGEVLTTVLFNLREVYRGHFVSKASSR